MKVITELDGYVFNEIGEKPILEFSKVSRLVAAEGMVLLKNENSVLPLKRGEKVSLFGRTQIDYYKSGTGSGGSIVTEYVSNFLDGLRTKELLINEELVKTYENWIKENPADVGNGWAADPYYQEEMPLDENILKTARAFSETAVVFIGRLAGEARDLDGSNGSYYLADCEKQLLADVTNYFDRVCVVLNIGNIIDFSWINDYNVSSVLIAWQGGMEGGNACADVLCGDVPACGRLSGTAAKKYTDYATAESFNRDNFEIIYDEDIYVGYRYFETFAKDRVLYPFGYGLSYTKFEVSDMNAELNNNIITVSANVKNTGEYNGKEVLQLYYSAPQGLLGKPAIELGGYCKTNLLAPGEGEHISISLDIEQMVSYDDSGVTGHRFCDVLEGGEYHIYLGTNAKDIEKVYTYNIENTIEVCKRQSAVAPVKAFKRLCVKVNSNGGFEKAYEDTPLRTYDLQQRIKNQNLVMLDLGGDKGIKLYDVYRDKNTLDEFISQFNETDLMNLIHGEGMNSGKTTAGTTGIIGGITKRLQSFGIPVLNLCDGPSGIRMLTGTTATSMPCGTQIACTWNKELVKKLYRLEGIEMRTHKMDILLGPGMNIHRSPICGRNFEYFSEDPYLSGTIGSAMIEGIKASGANATIKHFFANNREEARFDSNSVLSERAAREIYLKPFEIAVKSGADVIMTSYNAVNGIWSAGNYDLNTEILRNQWHFDGLVMTDWWAKINDEGEEPNYTNYAAMLRAQNDVYMVVRDAESSCGNLKAAVEDKTLSLGILQRSAKNICKIIMNSAAMQRYIEDGFKTIGSIPENFDNYIIVDKIEKPEKGVKYTINVQDSGIIIPKVYYVSKDVVTAQGEIFIIFDNKPSCRVAISGTEGETEIAYGTFSLDKGVSEVEINCIDKTNVEKIEFLQKVIFAGE